MEFRILGDLEAEAGGSRVKLGPPGDRKVLGLLLLNVGRVVPLPRLVDALWDDDPPVTAVKQVRNAASRLRSRLADAGAPGLIQTRGGGYLVAVPDAALDSLAFEAKVTAAQEASDAGRLGEAARLLHTALGLWRGPLLADLDGRIFADAAAAWEERRCAVAETCHDHQLALGRHREILAELARFADDYPLREKPAGHLMLALYRCGRQADALAVYARMRERLAIDLGLDPGPDLQRLHQQILTADPALNTPEADHVQPSQQPVVPRQLPAAAGPFTGRQPELKTLDGLLGQADEAGTVVISAIDGTAGVGKTALAVYWAHQVADRFPDGQLYVNLRGFDPAAPPVDPAETIRGFLDAYEVPAARIPASPEAQAGLYRSVMAGKRALVVLDNARDVAQVRPLLPGSPGCVALVTSRNQLTGLAVAHGAQPITLGLFSDEEARSFLARRLGAERVERDQDAAADLIGLCARLPLALSIVAARALRQPDLQLATLAAQLRDTARRLDELDSGDAATGVRPVLSWSYYNLTAEAARMFRLLAVHPGPDISAPAAASLGAVPRTQAPAALAELTRAHLLTEHTPGRFTFHDLLRAYAAEQARAVERDTQRREATRRMLDHYVYTGQAAARLLNPSRTLLGPGSPARGAEPEQLPGREEALAWFMTERQVLLRAAAVAADEGFDDHAWKIPWTVVTFLEGTGRWRDWMATGRDVLAAAQRHGGSVSQANGHRFVGLANARLGLHEEAVTHLQEALDLAEQLGNRLEIARDNLTLGWVLAEQGRHREALSHAHQALDLFTAAGHDHGQAGAHACAASCLAGMGDVEQAVRHGELALTLQRELGNLIAEADSWDTLGYAHYRAGRSGKAVEHYQRALGLCRQLGDRYTEAQVLKHIGDAHHGAGDTSAARGAWQQALLILDELEHPEVGELRDRLRHLP